jgi:hypothetical protein
MNTDEAIRIVETKTGAPAFGFLRAIAFLGEPENDETVSIQTLLTALYNSEQFGKNITPMRELAVSTLYRRTKRPRKSNHQPYEDFIADPDNWNAYLKKRKLIEQ